MESLPFVGEIPLPEVNVPFISPAVSAQRIQILYSLQNGVNGTTTTIYTVNPTLNHTVKFCMTGFYMDCGITANGNTIVIYDTGANTVEKFNFSNRVSKTQYLELGNNVIEFFDLIQFNVNVSYTGSVTVILFGFLQPL